MASRVVWGVFFSDWQAAGGCPDELRDKLKNALLHCGELVRTAASRRDSGSAHDRKRMTEFCGSIGFRRKMLDLLYKKGVAAVVAAAEEEERRRNGKELESSTSRLPDCGV